MGPVASTAPVVAAQLVVGIPLLPPPRRQRIPAAAGLSSLSLSFSLLILLFFQKNKPQAQSFHTADQAVPVGMQYPNGLSSVLHATLLSSYHPVVTLL